MALIPYPADGWNTFLTIAEADVLIPTMTNDGLWLALDEDSKNILLVNSANYLKSIAEVNDNCDFKTAQAIVIQTDLVSNGKLLGFEYSTSEYESVKVATIEVKFSGSGLSTDSDNIPPTVSGILRDCLVGDNGNTTRGFTLAF